MLILEVSVPTIVLVVETQHSNITENKTYLYNVDEYAINKQLGQIIEHLNKTIIEKKLEF